MMNITQKSFHIKNKDIPYTHIETGSSVICFMFSGMGYTYDKPLMYYSTMTMLENKCDVVHVHYSYGQDLFKSNSIAEISKMIFEDVNPIINEVLKVDQFKEVIFLGKSLGSIPIINGLMKQEMYMDSKMILLTPLLKFDSISEVLENSSHSALMIIGENDPHYIPSKIEVLEKKKILIIEKIQNADHSLNIEPFDTYMSISTLETVMKKIQDFVKK